MLDSSCKIWIGCARINCNSAGIVKQSRKREDSRGISSSDLRLVQTNTWYSMMIGCGLMQFSSIEQVEEVLRSANVAHRQEAMLGLASVITFACAVRHMSLQLMHICGVEATGSCRSRALAEDSKERAQVAGYGAWQGGRPQHPGRAKPNRHLC